MSMNTRTLSIAVAILLISGLVLARDDLPESIRFKDEETKHLYEQQFSLFAEPSKNIYWESEDVIIRTRLEIHVEKPIYLEPFNEQFAEQKIPMLRLFRGKSDITSQLLVNFDTFYPSTIKGALYAWQSPDGGRLKIETLQFDYTSEFSIDEWGLVPGKYRGYFDVGVTSPWFEFEIVERSKEAEINYSLLTNSYMRRETRDWAFMRRETRDWALDSLQVALLNIIEKPLGTPLRCELIRSCLLCFIEGMNEWRWGYRISATDSNSIVNALKVYCEECPDHSFSGNATYNVLWALLLQRGMDWLNTSGVSAYSAAVQNEFVIKSMVRQIIRLSEQKNFPIYFTPEQKPQFNRLAK